MIQAPPIFKPYLCPLFKPYFNRLNLRLKILLYDYMKSAVMTKSLIKVYKNHIYELAQSSFL